MTAQTTPPAERPRRRLDAGVAAVTATFTARRSLTLAVLGVATIAMTAILEAIDPSHMSNGPTIFQFEFAGSRSHAMRMLAEWGAKGQSAAHLSLVLDYGYMLSYGLFFALAGFAIRDVARRCEWRRLASVGSVVPFFALAAAAFDAAENVALLLTLGGDGDSWAPPFATVCSSFKLALIGSAIAYVVCGVAFWARARRYPIRLR